MLARLLPLLNKVIPTGLAIKGMEKISPKIGNFFSGAFGAGYTADQAIDFLRNKLKSPGNEGVEERLDEGQMQGTLRPDEGAARKRIKENEKIPNMVKGALVGGAALAGGMAATRMGQQPQEEQQVQPVAKPKSRDQATQQYNEMQKKKKLIDQLQQDFSQRYGEANAPQAPQGAMGQQQEQPLQGSSNIERLIQLLQQRKQGMQ